MMSRFLLFALALFVGVQAQTSTPFLSFPVTIADKSVQLAAFGDQTVDEAIMAFCYRNQLAYDEVGAALTEALKVRLASKPADAIIFTFKVMLDQQEIQVNMHEGWTVADTVRNFCEAYRLNVAELGEQLVTLFTQQIEDYKASGIPEPEPVKPMAVFTIPVDGVNRELQHFEGADEVEEVRAFCLSHGFLTDELMAGCLPPLVNHVRDYLRGGQEAAPAPEPLFTMPITVDGVEKSLVYYSGQDPAEVARAFLLDTGVTSESAVGQLASLIVDRATVLAKAAAGEAKLQADPLSVARLFCLNRWNMISDALLTSVPGLNKGEQPVSADTCAQLLTEMILAVDQRLGQTAQDPKELEQRDPLPEELFSLTVTVAPGQYAELVFLSGMVPRTAAQEFAARHNLGEEAVAILEGAIVNALQGAQARSAE